MINFKRMWKTSLVNSKRNIKEVEYKNIKFDEYKVIDVRSNREFKEGHINGAINIPLPEIKKKIDGVITNKEEKILIYCKSGIRSKKAAQILEQKGYKNILNLKGGIDAIGMLF